MSQGVGERARTLAGAAGYDRLFIAVALLVLLLGMREPIVDPDLGWHLKGGEHVWLHGWPPTKDEFSHTIQGRPWIAYSWLAELVFWLVTDKIGFHALIIFCAILVAAAFVVVYLASRDVGASPPAAFAITMLGAIATTTGMSQRPVLASYLFAALFWRAIARYRRKLPVRLWLLIPLTVVWVNVHVFFVYGLAWLWAAALWEFAEARSPARRGPLLGALGVTALACSAAVLVNPYGVRLVTHVVEISTQPSALPFIIELGSPDFHGPSALLLPFLLAMIAALAWAAARPDPFELGLALLHLGLALYMRRNIPFLVIVATPLVARAVTLALGKNARPSPSLVRIQMVLVIALSLLVIRSFPRQAALEANVRPGRFPVAAVEFLKRKPPLGRMMNTFNWGGFLIYTLYPRYQVSVDGRGGAYGEAYLRDLVQTQLGGEGWQTSMARLSPDFVLCERDSPLAVLLAATPRWTKIYTDNVATIFVRADHPLASTLSEERRESPAGRPPVTQPEPPGPATDRARP